MAEVVLTSMERGWLGWAKQFAAHRRDHHYVTFRKSRPTFRTILDSYTRAARLARNGKLIISAGHGGATSLVNGSVDLAPSSILTLQSVHLRLPIARFVNQADRDIVNRFQAIGNILTANRVKSVLFISCDVGNAMHFLGRIARAWHVSVAAYRLPIVSYERWFIRKGRKKSTFYVYLKGRRPRSKARWAHCAVNYPSIYEIKQAWRIGS